MTNHNNFIKLANTITLLRILLGLPISIALFLNNISLAWILLVIGGLSDWLDGWIARKGKGGSKWGAQADPLADKIILLGPIIWLVQNGTIPLWSVWILISREYIITAWRKTNKNGAPASQYGKLKTLIQFVSILLLLFPDSLASNNYLIIIKEIGLIGYWISLFMAVYSSYKYINAQSV